MNVDTGPLLPHTGRSVHEVQLALTFVSEALEELAALQATRETMEPQAWRAAYEEVWAYFARSHEAYVLRAAALLATPPAAPSEAS